MVVSWKIESETINSAESTATALISSDIILFSGLIIDSEEYLLDIGI